MRDFAPRFSASCSRNGATTQLRLLPQPLYRLADEKRKILDGGLFALVVSNDHALHRAALGVNIGMLFAVKPRLARRLPFGAQVE